MNLPQIFLADLPPEAELTPLLIEEACRALRRNREQHFLNRSTDSIIATLDEVGKLWRDRDNKYRKLALSEGSGATGFSSPVIRIGLDDFFGQLTARNLEALLKQDLGDPNRLDRFTAESATSQLSIAVGPELLAHIAAGNVPNPAWMSMVLGLLTRSAQFVKCSRGTSLLPRLFGHALHEVDPRLGSCLEIAEWKGGTERLEESLFTEADCVTASGSDEAVAAIRKRLPQDKRFLGYGQKLSFGYIAREALAQSSMARLTTSAVDDITAWDQMGCLSPHVLYVEEGGSVSTVAFAEALSQELAQRESTEPRGQLPTAVAATIASRRSFYEVRAAHSSDTRMWTSPGSTAWTVVFEADPLFQMSCLHRFIYVKPVANLEVVLRAADQVRGKVSTVGVAAPDHRTRELAMRLARWGVTRVCPLGQMQKPPLTWRHDGRPALGDLVTWTDWESATH